MSTASSAPRRARTGDRAADTREHHRRSPGGKGRVPAGLCEECRAPWPCLPIALVEELERERKLVDRLRRKAALPEVEDDARPGLPPGRRWRREWRPSHVRRQLAWARRAVERIEVAAVSVLDRMAADADGAIGSVPPEAGGSPAYEADGSRTGRVPNRVIARERRVQVRDSRSGELVEVWSWQIDPVERDAREFLRGLEALGDVVEAMDDRARRLHGLDAEAACQLVDPKPGRCENENCRRWCAGDLRDRLIIHSDSGLLECEACYRYRRRTGEPRPAHLCQRDLVVRDLSTGA